MIFPFLQLLPQIRFHIYKDMLTPDLFNLMDSCRVIRKEGLTELKGRIQRLRIGCEEGWGVLECKQAYLWHFGEPEMIFERTIPIFLRASVSSRGVVFVGKDNNFQGAIEHTFKDWRSSTNAKRMIPIEGLVDKVDTSDVLLFVHRGMDYLLVRGKVWRLIDLTSMNEIILGKANCCIVDAVSNANYIITYQYKHKSPGGGYVRWCEISQLIKGEAHWRECIVDETPYYLQLDVVENQIIILEMITGECPGRQRRTIHMESGQWVCLTQRPAHEPSWDSPIYRLRQQSHATHWEPITMKHVAIGGVPCYQWDLRKQSEIPPLEMRCVVKKGLPQTIRALYTAIPHFSEVVAVQSIYNGSWPMLNVVYRVNQILMCKTWRLMLPSQPFAELECLPGSKAYVPSDLHEDQWGENVIIRALRANAHWAWEPLMDLFRNRLIEESQNVDKNPDQHGQDWLELGITCDNILHTAALWNRPKFVEFFFCQWLPPLEKELKMMSIIIYDIDSKSIKSITSIDMLMRHLRMACKLGHVDVALSLIKYSALNISLSDWKDDFAEWPPLEGAMSATYGLQWSAVIPMITAQNCSERDRITLYRLILGQHIRFFENIDSDPEGFEKLVVDLCNSESALLNTTEAIAAAAVIANRDLIGRVSEQAEIDLPPYNGEFSEWEDIAYEDSLIFHAIQDLRAHPEAREWFINWLLKRKLPDRVEEALELMRPEWHKKQRPQ